MSMDATRESLRRLVDVVWGHAFEDQSVPATSIADALIDQVFPDLAPAPINDAEVVYHKVDNDRQVFFYEQEFYVLSNFSAFSIWFGGHLYPTAEHAYHAQKFEIGPPGNSAIRSAIRGALSAHNAFKIAEANKDHYRLDWKDVRIDIMRDILVSKAMQHEYLRRKLLETADRILIEDSWRDDFWGWGPNRDGQNQLGTLWMQVRTMLRNGEIRPNG